MKVSILGFGREGKSLLKFLKKNSPGTEIKILDQKIDKNYLKKLKDFDVVYRSPGVPYNLPEIQKAIKKGVKFSSATGLFFEKAKGKIIGVTGTKGKGTTSTLLYKILKNCGKNAFLAGNIGKPVIELLPQLKKNSITVFELSSFQLQDLKNSPEIAVVLGIFPDHQDIHKNFKEYFNAKANVAKWQKKNDRIFYFKDERNSEKIASKSRGRKMSVSAENFKMFKQKDLKIPGEHNFKNAVMAATIALFLGCPKNKILKTVKNFKGNEHRLEPVKEIKGIRFYNDSASTNPQTAAAAVRSFKEPKTRALKSLSARPSTKHDEFSALVLISGGKDKGLNYSPLNKALKNSNTKLVILFGENKNKIHKAIKSRTLSVKKVKSLREAVSLAYREAKILNTKYRIPATIIFSPASASFDMFKDYADRGKKFKELVKKLK